MKIVKIQSTYDYQKFSFLGQNREVSKLTVKNLKKSINELDLTMYNPIIVDELFRIIDGQHRFFACMELEKPIYYVVMDDHDSDEAMVKLNIIQRAWRQEEFLNYHAQKQGGRWRDLQIFADSTKLGVSNACVVYADMQLNAAIIKAGKLQFNKNPKADEIVSFLMSQEVKNLKFSKSRPFVLAVRKAFEIYDTKEMNKIKSKVVFINHSANYEQYLIAFKNLLKK